MSDYQVMKLMQESATVLESYPEVESWPMMLQFRDRERNILLTFCYSLTGKLTSMHTDWRGEASFSRIEDGLTVLDSLVHLFSYTKEG